LALQARVSRLQLLHCVRELCLGIRLAGTLSGCPQMAHVVPCFSGLMCECSPDRRLNGKRTGRDWLFSWSVAVPIRSGPANGEHGIRLFELT